MNVGCLAPESMLLITIVVEPQQAGGEWYAVN